MLKTRISRLHFSLVFLHSFPCFSLPLTCLPHNKTFYIIQVSTTYHHFFVCIWDFEDLWFFSTFKVFGPLTCMQCYATWISITLQRPVFHSDSSHCVVSFVKSVIAKMSFCFHMLSVFATKRNVWLENCHVVSNEFCIPLKEQDLNTVLESFCC